MLQEQSWAKSYRLFMKAEGNFHARTHELATRDPKVSLGVFESIKEGRLRTRLSLLQHMGSTRADLTQQHCSAQEPARAGFTCFTLKLGMFLHVWLVATLKWYTDLSLQYGCILNYYPIWSSIPRNKWTLWLMDSASSHPLLAAILKCLAFEMLAITVVFLYVKKL